MTKQLIVTFSIILGFKEDKQAFLAFMKDIFRGSGIREATYRTFRRKEIYQIWKP